MSDSEVLIQALKRPSFLGQLYQGSTSRLLNYSLFPETIVRQETVTTPCPNQSFQLKRTRSLKERAHMLNVSGEVSLSVLGGALELKGFGSYLDRSESTEESTSISAIVRVKTVHSRLDPSRSKLQNSVAIESSVLKDLRATHVVTAITYGGTMLASLTERKANSEANKEIGGSFSMNTIQKLAAFGGAKGSAEMKDEEKEKLRGYNLNVSLTADFKDFQALSITPFNFVEKIEKGIPNFSSSLDPGAEHGVPLELTLTPLDFFDKISVVLLYRELAQTDLSQLQDLYDDLITLGQQRNTLSFALKDRTSENGPSFDEYFPALHQRCRLRREAVERLLAESRGSLGIFLRKFRELTDNSGTAQAHLEQYRKQYFAKKHELDEDLASMQNLEQMLETSRQHAVPLATPALVSDAMSNPNVGKLVLALVNSQTSKMDLLQAYSTTASDLRNSDPSIKVHEFLSFFVDEMSEPDLLRLDDNKGTIQKALLRLRNSGVIFLIRGPSLRVSGRRDWSLLNDEGLGVLVNKLIHTKYTGQLRNGVPHGTGSMIYMDGSTYHGDWVLGKRDGNGAIVTQDGHRILDTKYFEDFPMAPPFGLNKPDYETTIVIRVSVYNDGISIADEATFSVQVVRDPPVQFAKIAKVFGWREGQRYSLTPDFSKTFFPPDLEALSVVLNGETLEKSPYPAGQVILPWPNDIYRYESSAFRQLEDFYQKEFGFRDPVSARSLQMWPIHIKAEFLR